MHTHTAVVKEVMEECITIKGDASDGYVTIGVTETVNGTTTGRGNIALSNEGFLSLIAKTLNEMGYSIIVDQEMF